MSELGTGFAYAGNPYRQGKWTSHELPREKEHVRWLLAEVDLESGDARPRENGLGYLLGVLNDVDEELARRERLARSRYAPKVRREPVVDRSALIAETPERLSTAELLRRYGVRLEKRGKHLVCRCPLPGLRRRRLRSRCLRMGWYCFGCLRGGDVFELARWMPKERSFVRVVERLGREVGVRK